VAGHSGQFTPGGYLSTVIHTTLAGIEPTAHAQFLACTISYLGYVCILLFAFSGFSFVAFSFSTDTVGWVF